MGNEKTELLPGTLEMLVLKALCLEPMHSWGIGQRLDQWSSDTFRVAQGSLHPALQRMLRKGWIRSKWQVTENNRRGRYYSVTRSGRRQLEQRAAGWDRASAAIDGILGLRPSDATS
ncbi:MAG TPA: PadR family transcriptional regulator [Thermoanaerobaculia bacterium]|jgi:transcriptional regulator